MIDCDGAPFCPDGFVVEEHQKGGFLQWNKDLQKDALWRAAGQQNGKVLEGHDLLTELKGKPVLNASVLDYLVAHPQLIPGEWKGKCIFFWGTIYRNRGNLYVRYLCWGDSRWDWDDRWLGSSWGGGAPAVMRAS